jgi:hypothetical protein
MDSFSLQYSHKHNLKFKINTYILIWPDNWSNSFVKSFVTLKLLYNDSSANFIWTLPMGVLWRHKNNLLLEHIVQKKALGCFM